MVLVSKVEYLFGVKPSFTIQSHPHWRFPSQKRFLQMSWSKYKDWIAATGFLTTLLFISLFAWVQLGTSRSWTDKACAQFPQNLTSIVMEKNIWNQWNWEYRLKTGILDLGNGETSDYIFPRNSHLKQKCPTATHDVVTTFDGGLVGKSDGKVWSLTSKNYIRDCHGSPLFQTLTGSAWETLLNDNDIWVSFELRDRHGKEVFGYVEGTHFWGDEMELKLPDGRVAAKMKRDKLTLKAWQWVIEILIPGHPLSDPYVLASVAARRSFAEKIVTFDPNGNTKVKSQDKTDVCNHCWLAAVIISSLLWGLLFGILIYLYWETIKFTASKCWVACVGR